MDAIKDTGGNTFLRMPMPHMGEIISALGANGEIKWVMIYKPLSIGPTIIDIPELKSATQPKPPQGLKADKTNF
jgi:hypothetical protein